MMRLLFWLIVIISLFIFVFIASETWETQRVIEDRNGVEYSVTKHSIHWERFFDYIKSVPGKIQKGFSRICRDFSRCL